MATEIDMFGNRVEVDFDTYNEHSIQINQNQAASPENKILDTAVFALTDAVSSGDRKLAWSVYTRLIQQGYDVDRDITPKLWWLLKTAYMLQTGTGSVHPYVAKKMQKMMSIWNKQVLTDKSLELFESVIESRKKGVDIELLIEKWIITIPVQT